MSLYGLINLFTISYIPVTTKLHVKYDWLISNNEGISRKYKLAIHIQMQVRLCAHPYTYNTVPAKLLKVLK